ncbi:MAG: DUF1501 domain-containing protein [Terrimicrobiaceae bacterium]
MKPDPSPVSGAALSRRRFLRQGGCAALTALPILNTILNLRLFTSVAGAAEPGPGEYRALVCLFLSGGNDSFNMLVPRGASEYAEYALTRSDLALPQDSLLALDAQGLTALELGLHPAMPHLQELFNSGKAAFVANVGTLIQPTTRQQWDNESVPLPLGLFSHSDQIEQWQTSIPQARTAIGWGGRMADILRDLNPDSPVSMNISLSGNNVWQSGLQVVQYTINDWGIPGLDRYGAEWGAHPFRRPVIDSQMAREYDDFFSQTFMQSKNDAMEAYEVFSAVIESEIPGNPGFPDTQLGRSLQQVARTISNRSTIGHVRQTFFVNVGGWDHHDEVLNAQNVMLADVSASVAAFQQAMETIGMANHVTLFSASDFARTLTSNGRGSDHAWGGNHFVVGGAVNGRTIYGDYPSLAESNPLNIGRGSLIPTTSADEYFAELALWMGVPPGSLSLVLPNITNFYSPGSSPPLGFLA